MRSTRLLTIAGLAAIVATGVTFQACGGDAEVSLPDAGGDGYVPPGNDGDLPDTFVPPSDDASDDAADAAPVDAGASCSSTPCIVGLAVGGRHACALAKDGTVRCWGDNQQGQLGNGVPDAAFVGTNQPTPVTIASLSNIAAIGASPYYNVYGSTCARTGSNTELCWGSNGGGQLGLNADAGVTDNLPHPIPGAVQGLPSATGGPAPGNFNSCAISGSDLICWGANAPGGMLGRGSVNPATGAAGKATAIEAGVLQGSPGYDYSLALLADGTVLSWGNNGAGQLGRVTGGTDIVPKPVASITGVTQISAGLAHACAVNGAGAVYCWGDNTFAQIGQGAASNQPVNVPVVVPMPASKKATQVSCANYHSCALMTDGSVACWGRNNSGQSGGFAGDAGDAAYNPVPVPTAVEIKLSGKALAVGAGGADANNPSGYTCALIEGGSVQCWGSNADGELGRGDAGSQACAGGPCIVTPGNVAFP